MKKILLLLTVLIIGVLAGCSGKAATISEDEPLKVGVTAGPHEDIIKKVESIAEKDGFEMEVVVFNDYVMPNTALDEGELDVNIFQTEPFMEMAAEDAGLDLVSIDKAVTFPMGIYSDKYTNVDELKEGDKVGIPNHSTGEPRALMLFEKAGVIKLKEGLGVKATVRDIVENPLNLEFIPLEASQIPRQLNEVAVGAINTNYALESGRVPTEDSLFMETKDSPWVNIVATRSADTENERVKQLMDYYKTDKVKQFILDEFKGSVVPAW